MPLRFSTLYRKKKIPSRDFSHTGVWGGMRAGFGLGVLDFKNSPTEFMPVKLARRRNNLSIFYAAFFRFSAHAGNLPPWELGTMVSGLIPDNFIICSKYRPAESFRLLGVGFASPFF